MDLLVLDRSEDDDLSSGFGGALIFVRWSRDGSQPIGHLETAYLVQSDDRLAVRRFLHALRLKEVKKHLDKLVEEQKALPDW